MIEVEFGQKYSERITLSLGFFDCVHRGHRSLIHHAKECATAQNVKNFVFTFENSPFSFFGKNTKELFTYEERRAALLESEDVDGVIKAVMTDEFARLTPTEFLDKLFSAYNVYEVFSGKDFTYGYKGEGNVAFLKKYAEKRGVKVCLFDYLTCDGRKIASNTIRRYVINGYMEGVQRLLGSPYKMTGVVCHDAGRGCKIGIPTANIHIPDEKLSPREGVYATSVIVDGKEYRSVTNVGAKPTFNDNSYTVESNIIEFDGDLYGKSITVYFYKYLRPIEKFASPQELAAQVARDVADAGGKINE